VAKQDKIMKREIVFLLILAAALLGLRLAHMFDPFDREEGVFAYAAALTYDGGLPYKNVFDSNPPFIFYLYRAAFDMSGKTVEAVRVFTAAYIVFSMLLIYMLVKTFARASIAMAAAFFYAVFLNNGAVSGFAAAPGIFTHFTVIFAVLFMLDRDRTYERANFFLAGFLMSSAVLTYEPVLPAAIVPVVYAIFFIKEKKRAGAGALWYLAGFFSLAALAVLWAVKNSVLKEFFDSAVSCGLAAFSGHEKNALAAFSGLVSFARVNPLPAAAFIYSFARLFLKKQDQLNFALFFITLAILAGIIAGKYTQPVNFAALMPYLSILSALMIKDGLNAAKKMKTGGKAAAAGMIAMVLAGVIYNVYTTGFFSIAPDKSAVFSEARRIGLELKNAAAKNASLYVWPDEPEIYFYSGITARTRYINTQAFSCHSGVFEGIYAGLTAVPPDYMVLRKNPAENVFEKLLKTYYSKSMEGESFMLYKKGGVQ
jgi:4-amino-4-deoxy-L-arabinose transferase-like glycosyltransferase